MTREGFKTTTASTIVGWIITMCRSQAALLMWLKANEIFLSNSFPGFFPVFQELSLSILKRILSSIETKKIEENV